MRRFGGAEFTQGFAKDFFKAAAGKDPLKKSDGVIQYRYVQSPLRQKTFEVIGRGVGAVELYERRLY